MVEYQLLLGGALVGIISLFIKLRNSSTQLNELRIRHENTLREKEEKERAFDVLNFELEEKTKILSDYEVRYKPLIDIDLTVAEKEVERNQLSLEISELNEKYKSNFEIYNSLEKEIRLYENELETMEYGLYQPQFDFKTLEEYKARLEKNYLKQKECIKADNAIVCHTTWTVEGSTAKGKQMTKKYSKLMLYAFNGECDSLIAKIKWNTATRTKERILKAFQSINKLGESHQIEIMSEFLDLKLEEMALSHEYENKKYEEKEEQRRIREQMREEEKVIKELEKAQREADEEERRYQKALDRAKEDLKFAGASEVESLSEQVRLLEERLAQAHEKKERAMSMAQLTKVGHIYVISNVGSFGEDVFKIGMTRRLEPRDRVRELGDASVPFQFDVHAIIYSDNAPQLEYDLHRKFHEKRLNRINGRKEFFKVSLDEIEEFVKNHTDAELEFTKLAEAREFRDTQEMLRLLENKLQGSVMIEKFPQSLA